MFERDGLNALYQSHRQTLTMLNAVGAQLKKRFYRMDDAVDCMLIAALSGEAMVMIGPPGTAKSRLVRSFCHLLHLLPDTGLDATAKAAPSPAATAQSSGYFEYLLTQFTEPSELFGFYDLAELHKNNQLKRLDRNMMQNAKVVFLDEVFNASSAILNALLTFMNERKFHDRGETVATELQLLFAATNHTPTDPHLAAVFDRFLLRCRLSNVAREAVETDEIASLIGSGWRETHATALERKPDWKELLTKLAQMREDIDARTRKNTLRIDPGHVVFSALTDLVRTLVRDDLSAMSNRRLVKLTGLILSMRLLRADQADEKTIDMRPEDLDVITRFSLDQWDPNIESKLRQTVLKVKS